MIKGIIENVKNKFRKNFDHESKKLIKNSSWVFIANALAVVLAFLRSILIARGLGATTLGTYAVVIAFVVTIQEILKLNVALGIIRFGAQYVSEKRPDKLIALLKVGISASLLSALVSVIIIASLTSLIYPHFFSVPGLEKFIILYSIINGFSFLDNIGRGVLKIFNKFKLNSIIQMIMDVFEFSMIAFCIFKYPHNLEYFFYTVIATRFINSIICNSSVIFELKNELGKYINSKVSLIKSDLTEIRHFILGSSFSNTLKIFMNQGDILILNSFGNPHMVGVYTVAKKLGYSVLTMTDPLSISIYPQLSHLVSQTKFKEAKVMIKKITVATFIPIAIFLVGAYFFKDFIIVRVYGKDFVEASDPFFIHLIGAVQSAIFFWCVPLVQSLGLTTMRLRVYTMALILEAIIALLLVKIMGPSGVAIALLSANVLISILFTWYCFRHMNLKIRNQENDMQSMNASEII